MPLTSESQLAENLVVLLMGGAEGAKKIPKEILSEMGADGLGEPGNAERPGAALGRDEKPGTPARRWQR